MDKRFLTSIRTHGVLEPILAHPDREENIVVRDGQRRALAAREVELATIPAYVVDAEDETRIRIIQQYIANEHRQCLNDADRINAWRQLSLEGMSMTAVAKETGAKREEVKTGLAVAQKEVATEAVARYDLTLDQALVLAEFEDDPETLAELTKVARKLPEAFDHYAQRALDEKAAREEVIALRAHYEEQGYTVVDWPAWDDAETLFFRDLQTAEGEALSEENYAGRPGRAVAIGERWGRGEVGHVVVEWKAHGLRKISSTGQPTGGKMSEEEKAERRRVIANNKAWVSAKKVRRAWLAKVVARKRLPAGALAFAAATLVSEGHAIARAAQDRHALATTLLGHEPAPGREPLADLATGTPARTGNVILAIALGAIEATTGRHTWRNPTEFDRRYFDQLDAWGYTLSDVEKIAAGHHDEHSDDENAGESDGDGPGTEEEASTDETEPQPEQAHGAAEDPVADDEESGEPTEGEDTEN